MLHCNKPCQAHNKQSFSPMFPLFSAFQTMLNTLPAQAAQTWHKPTQFWQTIESIQTLRAQAISQWWQQAPQHLAAIQQAPTPTAKLGAMLNWQGQTVAQQWHLWAATQAHRTHMVQQLQIKPPQASANSAMSFTKAANSSVAAPSSALNAPAKPHIAPAKPAPAPITATLSLLPLDEPTPKASSASHAAVSGIQVSRTAASVARTSNGSTIGAAAASRRSVVARRQNTRRAARPGK
jgi:hypothetical protein